MKSFWRNSFVWLLACFAASFLLLVYPIYVIRPFRAQGASELYLALQVMRVRPALSILLAVLAAAIAFRAWNHIHRLLPRLCIVLLAALTVISTAVSFANVYELMFKPLRRPTFKDASNTRLDGTEQVIAVKLG